MKTKVLILYGGSSIEREVSLMTAEKILSNIDYDKYEVSKIEVPHNKKNTEWVTNIIKIKPDIVFIALHGGDGENSSIQGLLECLDIPYTGSKVIGSAISMDKYLSKNIMRINYIPVPQDIIIRKNDDYTEVLDKITQIGFPLVVKPNNGGSSIGIYVVNNIEELADAIDKVKEMNDDILVEKFISGREVTCGIFEKNGVLNVTSVLDIGTKGKFYDYSEKYEGETSFADISTLPDYLQSMIKQIAKKVFRAVNAKGYACVDMIVSEEQVYVLEINTLPGMTVKSLLPKAVEKSGNPFSSFIDMLIENELKNK